MTAIIFMVWLAFMVFNSIITPLLRMAISRNREYAADATGALITRNPEALASALQKISEDARVEVLDKQKNISTACIANPRDISMAFSSAFSTHPPIKDRIERLTSIMPQIENLKHQTDYVDIRWDNTTYLKKKTKERPVVKPQNLDKIQKKVN
jgi:Zn-dependent protease with chaperone function